MVAGSPGDLRNCGWDGDTARGHGVGAGGKPPSDYFGNPDIYEDVFYNQLILL